MNRPQALAIALLAALPTLARAQNAREVLNAHAKTAGSAASTESLMGNLNSYSKSMTGDHLNDWNIYSQAGWRAINKGYYDTAEHEFRSAIKAAMRHEVDDPRLVARAYADYAWALQKQGRNAQAEPLLKWALSVREAYFEPAAPPVVQNLNQLATLYSDLGRNPEAESLLRRAIDSQAKFAKANPVEHARSQTLMGLLLAAQRQYAQSEPYFNKAVVLRQKAQGSSHADTGDALNNLAWVYLEQGKDVEARPLFERALAIFERSRGESDTSVGHVADGLGQILAKQGQAVEAEAYFLRAISIWEESPDEGISLLEVLRHYADLLQEKGRSTDLEKIKARMAPLRARYTLAQERPGRRYRIPGPVQAQSTTNPPRIPG